MWTDSNGYKYEVRIHPHRLLPDRYIYRVGRSYPPYARAHNNQGLGWQYGDAAGNWYPEFFLKLKPTEQLLKDAVKYASWDTHPFLPEEMIIP